jgi:hypothetical protein
MTAKPPPTPPASVSPKGPGDKKTVPTDTPKSHVERDERRGEHANIRQNTHNQGYQQDR